MAFTDQDDKNILQASDSSLVSAGEGNDTYILANQEMEDGQEINIVDKKGDNTLKLVGGLKITSSQVASDTAQLTLSNGAVVNIEGASTFNFKVGGTGFGENDGVDKTFSEFAEDTLGVTVPPADAEGDDAIAEGGSSNVNEDGTADVNPPEGENTFSLAEAISQADTEEGLPAEYTLSDASVDLGEMAIAGVADAKADAQSVIDGAENAADLELDATYTLANTEFTAEETVTSNVAGLDDAVAAAEADVLTDAEQAIVDGAANAEDVTIKVPYALEDTVANLAGAEDGVVGDAASYTLTDEAGELTGLSDEEAALVEGAENSDDYTVVETLTLNDALAAETLPESYELDASVPRIDNSASVSDATSALDIIAGANNAADINVDNVYVWKVEDSAESIVAAIEDDAVLNAGEVRVDFEEGDQLTVEQNKALNGLDNLEGDLPPVNGEAAVLAGLQDLEAAQDNKSDFLDNTADNDLVAAELADDGDATAADPANPTNDEVEAAIEQADDNADEAVTTAENDKLDAEADLSSARAATVAEYETDSNGGDNFGVDDSDLKATDITEVTTNLDSLADDTRLSDANLAEAATEAQADVDADEATYAADGTEVNLAEGQTELVEVFKVSTGDVVTNTSLSDGDYITEQFAGTKQTSTVEFSGVSSSNSIAVTINGVEFTGTSASGDLDSAAIDTLTDTNNSEDISTALGITATANSPADKVLNLEGVAGESFTINGATYDSTAVVDGKINNTEEAMTAADIIADDSVESAGFTDGSIGLTGGTYDETAVDLGATTVKDADFAKTDDNGIYSAADLQAAIATAEDAVDTFVSANGDNAALLEEVRGAINAHIGAGGKNASDVANVDGSGGKEDLLAVRDEIATTLEVGEDGEVDSDAVDTLVDDIGGSDFAFEGTDENPLTAKQKAVNSAFADAGERVELNQDVKDAEDGFEATDVGSVLSTVETLQDERDGLIEAVSDAEAKLADEQNDYDATQQLVNDLDALEKQITDATEALTDSEEDGGLGVNLANFEDGTATGTSEDDVILLSGAEDGDDIVNFGTAGNDRLYVDTDFTINNQESDVDVAGTDTGDSDVLELFVQQKDGDTVLNFEEETFAGSVTSPNELTEVTLTGETGDVSISDDGFLTIA